MRSFLYILVLVALTGRAAAGEPIPEFILQTGHTGSILAIAQTDNGKFAITGSDDETAILWDATTGKNLRTFEHSAGITSVAISSDGKRVLTGSRDKTAVLWDAASGKRLRTFVGHTAEIEGVALSRDGKQVVTGSLDRTAIVWNTATGKNVQTLRGHTGGVNSVSLSRDGNLIVTGSEDTTAILWQADGGKKLQTFRGHGAGVKCVTLSSDGNLVATASWDKTACLWETDTGKKLQTFRDHTDWVQSVSLSEDGERLLTGSWDNTAILWESLNGKKLQSFKGKGILVHAVALSAAGDRVLIGSSKTATLFKAADGKELQSFDSHTSMVSTVIVSGAGKHIIVNDQKPILWSPAGAKRLDLKTPQARHEWPLALSSDGKLLVTGSDDRTTFLWEVAGPKKLQEFKELPVAAPGAAPGLVIHGRHGPSHVALSRDAKRLVTTAFDGGSAIVWDTANGKNIQTLLGHTSLISKIVLSDDGSRVLTGSLDGTAMLWETDSGKKLQTFPGNGTLIMSVAISGDARRVVTGFQDGTAAIWDAASAKKLHTLKGPPVPTGTFTVTDDKGKILSQQTTYGDGNNGVRLDMCRDGKRVVTCFGTSAILWDAASGEKIQTFQSPRHFTTAAISADGKHVWTVGGDGTTRLWDPATGKERCRLYSLDGGKDWLVVTPDGRFDGSPGASGFVTYRVPDTVKLLDDEATRRRFHRPGLLDDVWVQGR